MVDVSRAASVMLIRHRTRHGAIHDESRHCDRKCGQSRISSRRIADRQLRRNSCSDFDQLKAAGLHLTGVLAEHGGLWESVARSRGPSATYCVFWLLAIPRWRWCVRCTRRCSPFGSLTLRLRRCLRPVGTPSVSRSRRRLSKGNGGGRSPPNPVVGVTFSKRKRVRGPIPTDTASPDRSISAAAQGSPPS